MRKPWLLIALCLAAIVFVACSSDTEPVGTAGPTVTSQAPVNTTAPTLVPTAVPTETPVPTPTPTFVPIQRLMTGFVVDAIARNATEIELLVVRTFRGTIMEFETEGPIGIDAAHLLVHRDTEERVEVSFLDVGGRLIATAVNDLP